MIHMLMMTMVGDSMDTLLTAWMHDRFFLGRDILMAPIVNPGWLFFLWGGGGGGRKGGGRVDA